MDRGGVCVSYGRVVTGIVAGAGFRAGRLECPGVRSRPSKLGCAGAPAKTDPVAIGVLSGMPLLCAVLILAFLPAVFPTPAAAATRRRVAIVDVTVVDVAGARTRPGMTVLIEGNRITRVDARPRVSVPAGTRVVNGTGKFVIPGLWDMHWHSLSEPVTREIFLPLAVANGVTGVRDMFSDCTSDCGDYTDIRDVRRWRGAIRRGRIVGPRIVASSPLVDGPSRAQPGATVVAGAAEARRAVRDARRRGVDFVKVYGGLSRESYFALADEAKRIGIPFAGHVPDRVTLVEAAEAGQRSNEHLGGVLLECSTAEEDLRAEMIRVTTKAEDANAEWYAFKRTTSSRLLATYSEVKAKRLLSRLAERKMWQCPTLTILRFDGNFGDPKLAVDARLAFMPARLRDAWRASAGARMAEYGDEERVAAERVFEKELEIVRAMHHAGIRLLAGTDVTNEYCMPGFSLHDELELLVRAGLTPAEALRAATCDPAEFLGMLESAGTVEEGKLADLVVLDANPLEEITNTRRIAAVVADGKLRTRADLDAILIRVRSAAAR